MGYILSSKLEVDWPRADSASHRAAIINVAAT